MRYLPVPGAAGMGATAPGARPGQRAVFCAAIAAGLILSASPLLNLRSWAAGAAAISHGKLELVSETSSIEPGHDFTVGLHFELERGWHIYWKNPGDSGEPPNVTWQLPAGIGAGEIEWPRREGCRSRLS